MARVSKPTDPVLAYAQAVVKGKIVAGRLVVLACQRHLRDLVEAKKRGLVWDLDAALYAIKFFSYLRLPLAGAIDGKAFELEPFQQFIIGSLCGWKLCDGFRRFRTAFVEIGKGNGKTPMVAGVGLFGLVADGEAAAEIYPAATTREQASILFRDARRMVEASPYLREMLEVGQFSIGYRATDSFFRPVSAEHRGLDGKRPHMGLIDEIHEHPTAMVVDKIRAGTKNRRQALIFEITNSGYDRTSVCWQHHEYSQKILEGTLENDSWFAYVCGLDPCATCRQAGHSQPNDNCKKCDNWRNEKVWLKANPGLNTILPRQYLREQVAEAKGMPTKEAIVKRLNFCIWTQSSVRAIPQDKWDLAAGTFKLEDFAGRDCFIALDIGATSDFTAAAILFPEGEPEIIEEAAPVDGPTKSTEKQNDGEKSTDLEPAAFVRQSYTLFTLFWLPENPVRRDEKMATMIDLWRKQGHIRTTPGEVVDYDQVLEDLVELAGQFALREVVIDRGFQGAQMATNLIKHFGQEMVIAFPQGILSMSPPFRELIELLKLERLKHDNNPVQNWMVGNCVAEVRGGLAKPSKENSNEKIDGVTAGVMALGRAMVAPVAVTPQLDWV